MMSVQYIGCVQLMMVLLTYFTLCSKSDSLYIVISKVLFFVNRTKVKPGSCKLKKSPILAQDKAVI